MTTNDHFGTLYLASNLLRNPFQLTRPSEQAMRWWLAATHERIKWITYAWQMSFQSYIMSKISRSLTRDTGAH